MTNKRSGIKKWVIIGTSSVIFLACVAGAAIYGSQVFERIDTSKSVTITNERQDFDFSQIQTDGLTSKQLELLAVLEQEYSSQPDMIKYSDGVREPWCADFVSWAMREIDAPLTNPNSGSWRIPGVFTLNDYLVSQHAFHRSGDGYIPKMGDIVTYGNGKFGVHTNFVLRNVDGKLTTIGGNENHRILVQQYDMNDASFGVTGFGEFSVLVKTQ